jgi:hypothetical protein
MRYYIEAFDADGRQVLGNLDGQAALGRCKQPQKCKAWTDLPNIRCSSRIRSWRLVDDNGRVIARKERTN